MVKCQLWPLKPMEKKKREPDEGCHSSAIASGQASVTLEPGLLECCVSLGSSIIFLVLQAQYVLNYGNNIPPSPMMGSTETMSKIWWLGYIIPSYSMLSGGKFH